MRRAARAATEKLDPRKLHELHEITRDFLSVPAVSCGFVDPFSCSKNKKLAVCFVEKTEISPPVSPTIVAPVLNKVSFVPESYLRFQA
jgi:hypothetical protein